MYVQPTSCSPTSPRHRKRAAGVEARWCMLGRRLGRPSAYSEECPFFETGGAVVSAGCALERILPEPD